VFLNKQKQMKNSHHGILQWFYQSNVLEASFFAQRALKCAKLGSSFVMTILIKDIFVVF
jgi:hypothetical protein